MIKKILLLILISSSNLSFSQNSSKTRISEDTGWTSWELVFTSIKEGLYYFIPGLILILVSYFMLKKLENDHDIIKYILGLFMLGGIFLVIVGAFHFIFLISNLEIIFWSILYIGGACLLTLFLIMWIYQKLKSIKVKR